MIDVLLPSYNYASLLPNRIRNILGQKDVTLRLIVIEDGSTDDSLAVLRELQQTYKFIVLDNKTNQGWIQSINRGLACVTAPFFWIANCDDVSEADFLATMQALALKDKQSGFVFCRSTLIDEKGLVLGNDYENREKYFKRLVSQSEVVPSKPALRCFMHSCVAPNFSAVLFRKEVLFSVGVLLEDYSKTADWKFYVEILKSGFSFSYSKTARNYFRMHRNSIREKSSKYGQYQEFSKILIGSAFRMKNIFHVSYALLRGISFFIYSYRFWK